MGGSTLNIEAPLDFVVILTAARRGVAAPPGPLFEARLSCAGADQASRMSRALRDRIRRSIYKV